MKQFAIIFSVLVFLFALLMVYLQKDVVNQTEVEKLLKITLPDGGRHLYTSCTFSHGLIEEAMGEEMIITHEYIKLQSLQQHVQQITTDLDLVIGDEQVWQNFYLLENTSPCDPSWWKLGDEILSIYTLSPEYDPSGFSITTANTNEIYLIHFEEDIFIYRQAIE